MQLDRYALDVQPSHVAGLAAAVEATGFDGLWFAETRHQPFVECALAASATTRLAVGTNIAVAFARSPMVTAQNAWDLAELSNGRFTLGLGTQITNHLQRRFSVTAERPIARLREYVAALRAIFDAFQTGGRLKFAGDFYQFSLLPDFFRPPPIAHPDLRIHVAAVNEHIAAMAGEVADGLLGHPLHTPEFLREVVVPAATEGATRASRSRPEIVAPVFVAVSDDEGDRSAQRREIWHQVVLYGSTPNYRPILEHHGYSDATTQFGELLRIGDRQAIDDALDDDLLDVFCVTSTWDGLAAALHQRYRGLADRVVPYLGASGWGGSPAGPPNAVDETNERWKSVCTAFREHRS